MSHPSVPGDMRRKLRSTAALFIIAALAGSGVAFAVTGMMRHDYRTAATVRIESPAAEAAGRKALARSVPEKILSDDSLDRIASDLRLDANAAFTGSDTSAAAVILDLLAPREMSASEREQMLRKRLAASLGITGAGDNIAVVATTADPELSASISNHVADSIAASISAGALMPGGSSTSSTDGKRQALEAAEAELTSFEAARDSASLAKIQQNQGQIDNLQAEIATLGEDLATTKQLSEQAAKLNVEDVLSRAMPDDPRFIPLADLRERYAAARVAMDEVSVSHGPKHPRVIAANEALTAVRAAAAPALKRLQADLKQEERQRAASLDAQRKKLASLTSGGGEDAAEAAQFRALHARLETARNEYMNAMSAAETAVQPANPFSAVVSSRADAARATSNSTDPLTIALAGASGGLFLAIPFALAARARRRGKDDSLFDIDVHEEDELFSAPVAPVRDRAARRNRMPVQDVDDRMHDEDFRLTRRDSREPEYSRRHQESRPVAEIRSSYRPVAANSDVSVADRVLAVLASGGSGSHRPANGANTGLPPLLAAAMRGEARHERDDHDMRQPLRRLADDDFAQDSREELEDVRREMAELSHRVRNFTSRRQGGR